MEVTRTFLRSEKGDIPKQVRMAGSVTQTKGKYGEELRGQLSKLGDIKREAPVITAKRVTAAVSEPEQYTQDAIKTALKKLGLAVQEGLGKDQAGAPSTQPTTSGGGGGGGNKGYFSGSDLSGMSTQQLVDRDNRRYGDTFPDGAIGIGSKSTDDFSKNPEYQSTAGDFERERLAKVMSSLPSDYKQTEQRAFDDAEAYRKLVASGLDKTVSGEDAQVNVGSGRLGSFGLGTAGEGAPSGDALKPGSFGISIRS